MSRKQLVELEDLPWYWAWPKDVTPWSTSFTLARTDEKTPDPPTGVRLSHGKLSKGTTAPPADRGGGALFGHTAGSEYIVLHKPSEASPKFFVSAGMLDIREEYIGPDAMSFELVEKFNEKEDHWWRFPTN